MIAIAPCGKEKFWPLKLLLSSETVPEALSNPEENTPLILYPKIKQHRHIEYTRMLESPWKCTKVGIQSNIIHMAYESSLDECTRTTSLFYSSDNEIKG